VTTLPESLPVVLSRWPLVLLMTTPWLLSVPVLTVFAVAVLLSL